jgi:hypothetical protein
MLNFSRLISQAGTREVVGAINNLTEEQHLSQEETNDRTALAADKATAT